LRTRKQTKQTLKQTNKRTKKQTNNQTFCPAPIQNGLGLRVQQTEKQTNKETNKQTNKQSNNKTINQSNKQANLLLCADPEWPWSPGTAAVLSGLSATAGDCAKGKTSHE
jgi:hypothetical protein